MKIRTFTFIEIILTLILTAFCAIVFSLFMKAGAINYELPLERLDVVYAQQHVLELIIADYQQNYAETNLQNFKRVIEQNSQFYGLTNDFSLSLDFVNRDLDVVTLNDAEPNHFDYALRIIISDNSSQLQLSTLLTAYY